MKREKNYTVEVYERIRSTFAVSGVSKKDALNRVMKGAGCERINMDVITTHETTAVIKLDEDQS